MTCWVRCFWDEESIWFYFELDDAGNVLREVEHQEPSGAVLAAAALSEWLEARAVGRLSAYESAYGGTAMLPFGQWEGHDPHWLSQQDFERVWAAARDQIDRGHPR
jgi:hypothetical protein